MFEKKRVAFSLSSAFWLRPDGTLPECEVAKVP